MRSQWVSDEKIKHVLAALMPENSLACEVSLATGLRIGDVLSLKSDCLTHANGRFTIKEEKTGKSRTVYLPKELKLRMQKSAGKIYVFEGRLSREKHRTRQAVFKDLRRAAKAFRLTSHVSPHSLRKMYAVELYRKTGSLEKVRRLLNHSDEAVTMIYAMADRLSPEKRTLHRKS